MGSSPTCYTLAWDSPLIVYAFYYFNNFVRNHRVPTSDKFTKKPIKNISLGLNETLILSCNIIHFGKRTCVGIFYINSYGYSKMIQNNKLFVKCICDIQHNYTIKRFT